MDLEKAKGQIIDIINELKRMLEVVEVYVYEDLNIPEEPLQFCFCGYNTSEGYEYSLDELKTNFEKAIKVYQLFEADKSVFKQFMEWALFEINSWHFRTYEFEPKVPYGVAKEMIQEIRDANISIFEAIRKDSHEAFVTLLKDFSSPEKKKTHLERIKWLGTQIEFCELLVTLEKLDWIETFDDKKRASIIRTMLSLFDMSATQFKVNEDTARRSIYRKTTGKLEANGDGFTLIYDQIFTIDYKPKFDKIEKNRLKVKK
jgi:hypothetical protein